MLTINLTTKERLSFIIYKIVIFDEFNGDLLLKPCVCVLIPFGSNFI